MNRAWIVVGLLCTGCLDNPDGRPVSNNEPDAAGIAERSFRLTGQVDGKDVEFVADDFRIAAGTRWGEFLGISVSSKPEIYDEVSTGPGDRSGWSFFAEVEEQAGVAVGDFPITHAWFVSETASYRLDATGAELSITERADGELVVETQFAVVGASPRYCPPDWGATACVDPIEDADGTIEIAFSGVYVDRVLPDCYVVEGPFSPMCRGSEICEFDPSQGYETGGRCMHRCNRDEDCLNDAPCAPSDAQPGTRVCLGSPDDYPETRCDEAGRIITELCPEFGSFFGPGQPCEGQALAIAECTIAFPEATCELAGGDFVLNEFTECVDDALGIERPSGPDGWDMLLDAVCERAHECQLGEQYAATCHPSARQTWLPPERESSLASDGLFVDVQCLEWLGDSPCFDFQFSYGDCLTQAFQRPGVEAGAPCSDDFDCGWGLYCEADACPGICADRKREGSACSRDQECSPPFCQAGVCGFYGDPGSSTCTVRNDCPSDAACVNDRCVFRGPGEVCASSDECSKTFECVQGVCGTGARLGQTCDDATPCATGDFNLSRTVCILGSCSALAFSGAPCVEDVQCPPFHTCDTTCVPLPDLGEDCTDRCVRGACVDGTCAALADGAACTLATRFEELGQCEGGYCDSDTCVADLPDGSSCDRTEECGPYAWCSYGICVSARACISP